MTARLPYVEIGDPATVEPGALCYSKTITHGNDLPVGGVVAEVITYDATTGEVFDDPIVRIIRWSYRPTHPWLFDLALSDIDAETMSFFKEACDLEAGNIMGWYSKLKGTAKADNREWVMRAAGLSAIAATGSYTPMAQERYERGHAQRRAEALNETAPLPDIDFEARAGELSPRLEAAINEARARRG